MPLGWTELALVVVIIWLVARPWSSRRRPDYPTRTWRELTLAERLVVCLGPLLILGYWLYRDYRRGGRDEVVTQLGIAVVIGAAYFVLRRLRAR